MKLSIVIPNYNGRHLLERNLPAVIKAGERWEKAALPVGETNWEIIVVDDASTDGSVAFLKKKFPQVKRVVHQKNQRFAAACNSGVKGANGEIIVLLNNDVLPEPNFLKPLVKHFENKDVFAVGCKERDEKKGRLFYSGRSLGRFERGFLTHWRSTDQNKTDTLWATGGSLAADRKKWLAIGGMDRLFRPAYWEDIDLSWRAKKKDWKILFEPQAIVNHHHDTTNVTAFGKKKIKKYAYKNQFLFVWKNGDAKMVLSHIFWLPYHLLKAALRGNLLFWLGFFLALVQLPELLVKKLS